MLASPPSTRSGPGSTVIRNARFERLSRQVSSPPQYMSGLLLDPATIKEHQMANGFGSGSGLVSQNIVSSREPSPPRVTRQQSPVCR
jgi:hypothetical protein